MQRGEVWWVDLPASAGSEPGQSRPVLVVQSDPFNRSKIGTVVVVVLTTNLRLAEAPGNVRLSRRVGKLPKESVVNVSQVVTLDRGVLRDRVSTLPTETMRRIDEGLRLVLAL